MLAQLLAVLAPAAMAPGAGWSAGAGAVHACPGVRRGQCAQVSSWAATVPWRDCAECLPHRTLAKLPPDGIAIQIVLGREQDPPSWIRPLRWPPRLAPVVSPFEGLPARIGVFQTLGSFRRFQPYVFVFFGRPHPKPAQLARARAELATAELPGMRLGLARQPYVARACRGTTSPACGRIGVAVWLRRPAKAVVARIGAKRVELRRGRRYWYGFLRAHPPQRVTLHLVIWRGETAVAGRLRVPLRPGWG